MHGLLCCEVPFSKHVHYNLFIALCVLVLLSAFLTIEIKACFEILAYILEFCHIFCEIFHTGIIIKYYLGFVIQCMVSCTARSLSPSVFNFIATVNRDTNTGIIINYYVGFVIQCMVSCTLKSLSPSVFITTFFIALHVVQYCHLLF